ncbi:hypothetical protein D4R71_07680 [bacterium]|nr:MAG: hypothetical protein D4R71_07680 [bacterium]
MMTINKGVIKASDSHTLRNIRTAIQNDVFRALVELITNSDDSYLRLEEFGTNVKAEIEILYKNDGNLCRFGVRDFAEGMSYETIFSSFTEYGTTTSGFREGGSVRGYFGQGAKDALISMIEGEINTFYNGEYIKCKLYIEDNKPYYEIHSPKVASESLREKYGIKSNGTVVYFSIDREVMNISIPKVLTIHKELANNFLLRIIMSKPSRKVSLIDENKEEVYKLSYRFAEGEEVFNDKFILNYLDYEDFEIDLRILRHKDELNQLGENRDGGILILDSHDTVLDISLFKYDNEPLASKIFGFLHIKNFRTLLKNEEPVLKQERTGLDNRHPFNKILISKIEKRLDIIIEKEKKLEDRRINQFDKEESKRFKNAFKLLNEIAQNEVQDITTLGENDVEIEFENGLFILSPKSANITVGKRYNIKLFIDSNIVKVGSEISLSSSNNKVKLITRKVLISPEDKSKKIIKKHVTIQGEEGNIKSTIAASYKEKYAEVNIFVTPEDDILYDEGMIFQPQSISLKPNNHRSVNLLVYTKIIHTSDLIKITSDNDSIQFSPQEIYVNEADSIRNIAKYTIDVWGDRVGEFGEIQAEIFDLIALLDVKIISKSQTTKDSNQTGMFKEPYFNSEIKPKQRTSYSKSTGQVHIYQNFPSIELYLGEILENKKTIQAQVLIADLVAEQCFKIIIREKIEKGGILSPNPEAKQARIERDINELSEKFGHKIHKLLVDQDLFRRSLNKMDNK